MGTLYYKLIHYAYSDRCCCSRSAGCCLRPGISSSSCQSGQTCCSTPNGSACCPAANACCCPDNQRCCVEDQGQKTQCVCSGSCPGSSCSCTGCGLSGGQCSN